MIDFLDERRLRLSNFPEGGKFRYEYDFGDGWEHEILEKILTPEVGVRYPLCLKGKRACPPEDSQGPHGYPTFLRTIQDPNDPDRDQLLASVGGRFDPEQFDVDVATSRLRGVRWASGQPREGTRGQPRGAAPTRTGRS